MAQRQWQRAGVADNGNTITSSPFVASVPTDWKIADGPGDCNGDGKSDILWRNDNGNVLPWQMNGGVGAGRLEHSGLKPLIRIAG